MKSHVIVLGLFLLLNILNMYAQPMIRTIKNNTEILYRVKGHNDMSGCSEFNLGNSVEIKPFQVYDQPFLLGFEKPGLILEPIAFYDKKNDRYYYFINDAGDIDRSKLEVAFHAWQKNNGRKYKKGLDHWFSEWLCGDISLIHNHVEIFGYILNTALTRIENDRNYHVCMIDYSEGLFSRLFLDIVIEQKSNKGIIPHVKSFVGQGGFCQDGQIVVLG